MVKVDKIIHWISFQIMSNLLKLVNKCNFYRARVQNQS